MPGTSPAAPCVRDDRPTTTARGRSTAWRSRATARCWPPARDDGTIHLRDAATGRLVATFRDHRNPVAITYLTFSADGKAPRRRRPVQPRGDALGSRHRPPAADHPGAHRYDSRTSPSAPTASTWPAPGDDETVRIWDVTRDQESPLLQRARRGRSRSPSAPTARTSPPRCEDRTVPFRDLATGQVVRTLRGHTAAVHAVAISPDGRRAATSGADRTVRIWEVATGREIHVLRGHTDEVWSVAFAPDGKTAGLRRAATGPSSSGTRMPAGRSGP